jgi:hypothetical protein
LDSLGSGEIHNRVSVRYSISVTPN